MMFETHTQTVKTLQAYNLSLSQKSFPFLSIIRKNNILKYLIMEGLPLRTSSIASTYKTHKYIYNFGLIQPPNYQFKDYLHGIHVQTIPLSPFPSPFQVT